MAILIGAGTGIFFRRNFFFALGFLKHPFAVRASTHERGLRSIRRFGGRGLFRHLGQRSLDKEEGLRIHRERAQLTGRTEAANHIPQPRARGNRREKCLDILCRRSQNRLHVVGDEKRQRRRLRHGAACSHFLLMRNREDFPVSRLPFPLRKWRYTQVLPQFGQAPDRGGLC